MDQSNDNLNSFTSIYNSVINSSDEKLSEHLALFRKTACDSLKNVLENSPSDAEELLCRTAELVSTVSAREEKLRKTLKNGFLDAQLKQAMYLLGSGSSGSDPLEEHRKHYQEEIRGSFVRMQFLRDIVIELAQELSEESRMDSPAFQKLVQACGHAVEIDVPELEEASDIQLYIHQVLQFVALEQQVIPGAESEALSALKQRAAALSESKQGNTAKGKDALKLIAEWEARQKAEQIAAYWSAHPEEKAALEAEQASLKAEAGQLQAQIDALTKETYLLPSMQRVRSLDEQMDTGRAELQALGFFHGRRKKELQAEINQLTVERRAAWDASQTDRDDLKKRLDPLKSRMETITGRLQQIGNALSP